MWWRRRNRDRDLDEELRYHVERQIELNVRAGMTADEARRQALLQFGNLPLVKEDTRAVWTRVGLEQLLQDLRFGARILTNSPGLSATAAILIALVVGINTTIFSMVNGMVRRPAPGVTADDLVNITLPDSPGAPYFSYPDYLEYRAQTHTLRGVAAFTGAPVTLTSDRGSYAIRVTPVSANYFETVGVRPARGRTFTARDEQASGGSGLVAMLSDRAWHAYFEGREDTVGRAIVVNGQPATIIGIAPPGFRGTMLGERSDLWLPLVTFWQVFSPEMLQQHLTDRRVLPVDIIGRLAPGRDVAEAQAEFTTIYSRLELAYPGVERRPVRVVSYAATAGGVIPAIMPVFMALFSIVTLLTVAIVSANVANLMLARSVARQRETAVRQSLGASRVRVVRLLLAEGLSISLVAWLAACVMTVWAARTIPQLLPATPLSEGGLSFTPDWRVVGYALLVAGIGTVAFTLVPALRAWRQDPLPWLKAGEHGVAPGRSRLSSGLVALQLAFSVVLLTSAGLAYRSTSLMKVDVGFNSQNLLLVGVRTEGSVTTREAHLTLVDQVRGRLARLPGVTDVSYVRMPPPFAWSREPVRARSMDRPTAAIVHVVGPDYLKVMGLVPIAGRSLAIDDRERSNPAVLINRNLAETLWPGQNAVGQMMIFGPTRQPVEIVGVVPNAYVAGFNPERPDPRPNLVFAPEHAAFGGGRGGDDPGGPGGLTLYVRHSSDIETVATALGPALREVDPRVAISSMRSMDEQLEGVTLSASMIARLLAIFSLVSLVIAAIGQYAVVAFNMRRRVREFGVRIALGASSGQVLGGVLREGLLLTSIGLGCGLALSVAVAIAARSVLFNVTPTDPQTYAGVFALLAVVSLVACCVPARGASRVDPVQALRQE
jgi:predicted permease